MDPGSDADKCFMNSRINTVRLSVRLDRDPRRVITKPFLPGEETFPDGQSRVEKVLHRVIALENNEVAPALTFVLDRFMDRHRDLRSILQQSYQMIADRVTGLPKMSEDRKLLVGAYFTHEYSIEAAALFNPSMVPDPDQTGAAPDETRILLSLRAVGE